MARRSPSQARAEEDLSRAIIALFMKEPFFSHVLQGMPRRIDESTPTAAVARVGGKVELWVNPNFFASLSPNMRIGVIKHEVLHVILKHLFRGGDRDPHLWNLACDVVVNAHIGRWPLPEGAITAATFADLAIPEDATAEQVYTLLASRRGTSGPWEALGEAAASGVVGGHSDHSGWKGKKGAEADSSDEAGTAEAVIDELLGRAAQRSPAHGWANIPSGIRRAVDEARNRGKAKHDWKRTLRIFSAGGGRSRLVTSTRRESPRYGRTTLPGVSPDPREPTQARLVPGNKIRRLHTLAVAVDTSGSIGPGQLSAFFREIDTIWRLGTRVLVILCDASVQGSFAYRGSPPATVGGGGGTAFEPVFLWMREQHGHRFDGLVYLTDGLGPAPSTPPPCKLLWLVTSPEGMGEHLRFGRQLLLN